MLDWIIDILQSSIMINWVAPIVTILLASLIGYIVKNIYQSKRINKQLDSIKVAESKMIDVVRPFFIKGMDLSKDVLNDIRYNVLREYDLDSDKFMSLNDLKASLIFDIANTRYINEDEKLKLINRIQDSFSFLKDKPYFKLNVTENNKASGIDGNTHSISRIKLKRDNKKNIKKSYFYQNLVLMQEQNLKNEKDKLLMEIKLSMLGVFFTAIILIMINYMNKSAYNNFNIIIFIIVLSISDLAITLSFFSVWIKNKRFKK